MRKKILLTFCLYGLFITIAISGNAGTHHKNIRSRHPLHTKRILTGDTVLRASTIDSIIDFGKTLLNKKYKSKGPCSWRMDCSGYIACIFSQFNFQLPHSAPELGEIVENINVSDIKKGDLMFFKGRSKRRKCIGHVSLVIDATNGNIQMMHSCSRGIIIEDYQSSDYYKDRFVKAGRLPYKYEPMLMVDTLNTNKDSSVSVQIAIPKEDTLSIIGVGDMMLGSNYPSTRYLPPKGKNILTPVKEIIEKADIAFGNLEGVILSGEGTIKKCSNPNSCYAFKMPDNYVNYFKEAGFNVLSLANNHVGDFGDKGKENTVKLLKENDINFAGLKDYPYTTFDKNGIKYGFCAFSPIIGTVYINDSANAVAIVKHLDSICDVVIVSFHGGAEGSAQNHITKSDEIFLGENRGNPYKFARIVIDAGADIVFGHGPHVTRAIDLYKGRFIAYSMGNFATYGQFNINGLCGIAPIIKLFVNKKGEFLSGAIYSTKQIGSGCPTIDNDQKVLKEIINLTQSDIPDSNIIIEPDGFIHKK